MNLSKDDMMQIVLHQSAKHKNNNVEQIVTKLYNFYIDSTPEKQRTISLSEAQKIIEEQRQENSDGIISRYDLFSTNA